MWKWFMIWQFCYETLHFRGKKIHYTLMNAQILWDLCGDLCMCSQTGWNENKSQGFTSHRYETQQFVENSECNIFWNKKKNYSNRLKSYGSRLLPLFEFWKLNLVLETNDYDYSL